MKKTIKDVKVEGKRCLVRVDFNVPLDENKKITDATRIIAALPTIKYLIENRAKVILMSHLGRPKGVIKPEYSLKPAAVKLSELLGQAVTLADDVIGNSAGELVYRMRDGEVVMLENLRFHKEEEANDQEFSKKLAMFGDIYVNDAFGTAHRAHASTEGVTHFINEKVSGFLIEKELKFLGGALESPQRPFVAILGGSKVSDKINVISSLLQKVDTLLIGGGMAYTFLRAKGYSVGTSICEEDKVDLAKSLMKAAEEKGVKLLIPMDNVVAASFSNDSLHFTVDSSQIPADMMGLDIGEKTIALFSEEIKKAKTVIWNGPVGVFEMPNFAKGTRAIAQAVAACNGTTIIGGGDSAAAVTQMSLQDRMTHISTGGGASLEFLEGKVLPGIACLESKKKSRNKIIAGNWKMNKTVAETKEFVKMLATLVKNPSCSVVLCVPFTDIHAAVESAAGTPFVIGAQNVHWQQSGAFTGEVSVGMLTEAGVRYAVIGHSERRQFFGETDETVKLRTAAALAGGLTPIVCVGETLQQREKGKTNAVLKEQLTKALDGLTNAQVQNIVIAYEPVWAIGTGKTATAANADETIAFIRSVISKLFSGAGEIVAVLYGGSMNEKNAAELMAMPNIDGGLIGGASLDAEKFAAIIGAAI